MGLADVMETILDKGLVIDSYVKASLAGVEGLTVDARMAVASLNTYAYLCFAEAAARLDIPRGKRRTAGPAGGTLQGGATGKPEAGLDSAGDALREFAAGPAAAARRADARAAVAADGPGQHDSRTGELPGAG